MADIYEKMRLARERTGLNARQVADFLGVTQTELLKMETGKSAPTIDQLEKLEGLYCCELTLNETDPKEIPLEFRVDVENLTASEINSLAVIGRIALNSRLMAGMLE